MGKRIYLSALAVMGAFIQGAWGEDLSKLQAELQSLEKDILEKNQQEKEALPEMNGRKIVGEEALESGKTESSSLKSLPEEEKKEEKHVQSRSDTRKYRPYSSTDSPYTRKSSGLGSFSKKSP